MESLSMVFSLIFWSGFGLPLGVPPEKEDPLLAQVAPAECLFYSTWSGMAEADPKSANQAEQMLAEPEVKRLVAEIEKAIPHWIEALGSESGDKEAADIGREVVPLAKMLLTRSGAMFISKVKLEEKEVSGQGGFLLSVGEQGPQVEKLIDRLLAQQEDTKVTFVTIAGAKFRRIVSEKQEFTFGVKGRYLVAGWGKNAVEDIFSRAGGAEPAWLAQVKSDLPVDRRSTVSYVNLKHIGELLLEAEKNEAFKELTEEVPETVDFKKLAQQLGLENVEAYESVTGLNETGFVSRTLLTLKGEPKGLLAFAAGKPLTMADIAPLPGHTTIASAFRFDAGAYYDTILEAFADAAKASGGPGKEEFEQQLAQYEEMLGFKVRNDLLAGIGDTWYLYNEPGGGGLFSGWALGVSVRDKAKLQKVQDGLIAISGLAAPKGVGRAGAPPAAPGEEAVPEFGPQGRGELKQFELAGASVYHVDLTPMEIPLSPSWCLTDRTLLFGLYPQTITSFLTRNEKEESLALKPEVVKLFAEEHKPLLFSYTDTKALFEMLYPLGLVGLQFANTYMAEEGVAFDPSLIPSATAISRHLQPAVMVVRRHKEGVEIYQYQTLPGSSLGSSVAVSTALALPAVQAARGAAQRTQSSNNLKQIVLAMHNFADANASLPAAYNTSKDGKPLLSWRVHLLPYLEQQALYDQFHFDEPWDSDHNKKLIEQMPPTYRSPRSKAAANHTSYLAIRSKDSVLAIPAAKEAGKEHALGTSFAGITDGTSNTIAFVEVNDEAAVPWTKPDDYEYDPKAPAKAISNTWPGGFQAAFADGSVQFLSDQAAAEKLVALFTRSGGEATSLDDLRPSGRGAKKTTIRPEPAAAEPAPESSSATEADKPETPAPEVPVPKPSAAPKVRPKPAPVPQP